MGVSVEEDRKRRRREQCTKEINTKYSFPRLFQFRFILVCCRQSVEESNRRILGLSGGNWCRVEGCEHAVEADGGGYPYQKM